MSASDALTDLGLAQLRLDEEMKVLSARGEGADSASPGRYWQLQDILDTVTTTMGRLETWLGGESGA